VAGGGGGGNSDLGQGVHWPGAQALWVKVGIRFKPKLRFSLFGFYKLRFSPNKNRSVYLKTGNRQVRFRFYTSVFRFKPN
jgi:hypothetical protein